MASEPAVRSCDCVVGGACGCCIVDVEASDEEEA